jgi:tetratricopeptide (TPR) repeat protein
MRSRSFTVLKLLPLALIRMDEKAAPGLYTAARAAWAWLLATGDRQEDAAALLKGWRPKGMRRLELARTQMYLGRTRRALGEFQEAEDLFARACKTYWSCGCRYEAAVATWEIGVEYARREAWSHLESLAESLALKWRGYGEILEQALRELRWSRGSEEGPCSLWLRVVLESAGLRPGPFLYA